MQKHLLIDVHCIQITGFNFAFARKTNFPEEKLVKCEYKSEKNKSQSLIQEEKVQNIFFEGEKKERRRQSFLGRGDSSFPFLEQLRFDLEHITQKPQCLGMK